MRVSERALQGQVQRHILQVRVGARTVCRSNMRYTIILDN